MKKQTEMSVTINGKDVLAYPYTEKDYVQFENGSTIDEILENDLVSPTITHDTTAIKVGVGDSDVSSSVVDSTVNMAIKGQTYQNILPDPTLRNEMQGKSMQRLNEGYDSIETVDGVSKSAILKGQTLVNLHKKQTYKLQQSVEAQQANKYENIVSRENYLSCDMVEGSMHGWGSYVDLGFVNVDMLKPNTKYLVWFELATVPVKYSVSFMDKDSSNPLGAAYDIPKGQNYAILTTTDEIIKSSQILYVSFYQADVGHYEFKNVMIIEYQDGMENWDIPYFEGMQSVKMPVLTTSDKSPTILPLEVIESAEFRNVGGFTSVQLPYDLVDVKCTIKIREDYQPQKIKFKIGDIMFSDTGDTLLKGREYTKNIPSTSDIKIYNWEDIINGFGKEHFLDALKSGHISITFFKEGCRLYPYYGSDIKTNILHTPEEVVLRSLPNGVCDTLNLNTGEYVQRIGEVVLDGSQSLALGGQDNEKVVQFIWASTDVAKNTNDEVKVRANYLSAYAPSEVIDQSIEGICTRRNDNQGLYIALSKTKVATRDINLVKEYLQANPITVQYELTTPTIKTVDLSSSGNWEKIVLDGSEVWTLNQQLSNENGYYSFYYKPTDGLVGINRFAEIDCDNFTPTVNVTLINKMNSEWCTWHGWSYGINICIKGDKLPTKDVNGFKQWLRDNPTSVWYPTNSVKDATQVKQPIFFKDGHIIQSSGADNSLIPTLDYQAKTLNSYVMDLMKPNTKYTMKAKTANGTFTIDGANYNVNANGTFTSPSSMTDKLLIMSNKTNEEVMIIEGDVVSKTIPYFKGIKSAFENEDKIEVLSTGKNLYPFGDCSFMPSKTNTWHYTSGVEAKFGSSCHRGDGGDWFYLKAGRYTVTFNLNNSCTNLQNIGEGEVIGAVVKNDGWYTLRIKSLPDVLTQINVTEIQIVEESAQTSSYEPYKSNTTKIPLLSPLRSLSNGVYDEIILDRERNKAQITQKVKGVIFDGSESWQLNEFSHDDLIEFVLHTSIQITHIILSDRFITNGNDERIAYSGGSIYIRILKTKVRDVNSFKQWLSQNPTTVLYELATPVITEVDLEGFPYIYKDGHIFLNSEIAPTTEITYSINQCQQISASNEDILRHEKELTYLQKLIAQYVQVDYESVLLSLKV